VADSAALSLRGFIDIIHSLLFEAVQEWTMSKTDIFDESLREHSRVFPDLNDKLMKFIDVKSPNPMMNRYGKHDSPFTATLKGFYHTHLRDDAILIYKLEQRTIVLVLIVSHAEIEGKRLQKMAKKLAPFNPRK
jgi:mRNA-degrading endonuclease YafQ of YafQ-DinJ toxin-antitoxin module